MALFRNLSILKGHIGIAYYAIPPILKKYMYLCTFHIAFIQHKTKKNLYYENQILGTY